MVFICCGDWNTGDEDLEFQLALEASKAAASSGYLDDIIERFDALHFSITNSQVLGKYR